jgi:DNA-binding MltR family transcriptional regulator
MDRELRITGKALEELLEDVRLLKSLRATLEHLDEDGEYIDPDDWERVDELSAAVADVIIAQLQAQGLYDEAEARVDRSLLL